MWVRFFHILLLVLTPLLGEAFFIPGPSLRPLLKLHAQPAFTPPPGEASLWTRLTAPVPDHSIHPDPVRLRNWITTHPNAHWDSLQVSPSEVLPDNVHLSLPPVDPSNTPQAVRDVMASIHQYDQYLHYIPMIALAAAILDLMIFEGDDMGDMALDNNSGLGAMFRSRAITPTLIRVGALMGFAILLAFVLPQA
eukprot:Nitzschia sp. Nitz4//scaffold82_size85912//20801//21382//NITZ4_005132-RA/size85912-processed-gene-0.95-mRNA-1//1//CDS//3329558808//7599//frame0